MGKTVNKSQTGGQIRGAASGAVLRGESSSLGCHGGNHAIMFRQVPFNASYSNYALHNIKRRKHWSLGRIMTGAAIRLEEETPISQQGSKS
eukprot:scaffold96638_cov30-Tisochrysis_lutea.AAC.5